MTQKQHRSDRRNLLCLGLSTTIVGATWHRPIVNAVISPAHAQMSVVATSITISSLDAVNPFSRFIVIVDSSDNVLANCGASGGTATAESLTSGQYRVFADSNGLQNHTITVTTDTGSQEITVSTNSDRCNYLVATIDLPSGVITPANGEVIAGSWDCSTNQNLGCS